MVSTEPDQSREAHERSSGQVLLWEEYKLHIELYRFHIEIIVKLNLFLMAVTGAIVTYYFANPKTPMVKYALLLPLGLAAGLAVIFFYGAYLQSIGRKESQAVAVRLGLATTFEDMHLVLGLVVAGVLCTSIVIGLSLVLALGL